jgi:hypothetical protein
MKNPEVDYWVREHLADEEREVTVIEFAGGGGHF